MLPHAEPGGSCAHAPPVRMPPASLAAPAEALASPAHEAANRPLTSPAALAAISTQPADEVVLLADCDAVLLIRGGVAGAVGHDNRRMACETLLLEDCKAVPSA